MCDNLLHIADDHQLYHVHFVNTDPFLEVVHCVFYFRDK